MKNILAANHIGFQKVSEVTIPEIFNHRIVFGNTVLDKAFGGGVLPGSSFTLDAAKGGGKTTLMLQCCQILSEQGLNAGMTSGEECKEQLAYTARRLGTHDVLLASYTKACDIIDCITNNDLDWLIIDSWQRVINDDGSSIKTEANQKEVVARIVDAGKANNCVVGIIMQRTKAGKVKGASEIQHTVDANYEIEIDDKNPEMYRYLSSSKNRFGALSEQILELGGHGYNLESAVQETEQVALRNALTPANNAQVRAIKASADKQKILDAVAGGELPLSRLHKAAGMSYQKAQELCTILMNENQLTFDGKKWGKVMQVQPVEAGE